MKHIVAYGVGNAKRWENGGGAAQQPGSLLDFSVGMEDRRASIRIPHSVLLQKRGWSVPFYLGLYPMYLPSTYVLIHAICCLYAFAHKGSMQATSLACNISCMGGSRGLEVAITRAGAKGCSMHAGMRTGGRRATWTPTW